MHIKRSVNHDIMKIIEATGYGVGVVEVELGECDDPRCFLTLRERYPSNCMKVSVSLPRVISWWG